MRASAVELANQLRQCFHQAALQWPGTPLNWEMPWFATRRLPVRSGVVSTFLARSVGSCLPAEMVLREKPCRVRTGVRFASVQPAIGA